MHAFSPQTPTPKPRTLPILGNTSALSPLRPDYPQSAVGPDLGFGWGEREREEEKSFSGWLVG
ncbi:hypothetical protein DM02DRAFT_614453 [Periconia macrospinosa]|uniref:Uncharacterized protein n=1 Tax=Periconia macrospinosa TaxID=97972 RepID=A0A2V1DR60_9PLEO|nr:hypothetical protein DM02DRAFT_614453 [Periconia macrospinosa]